MDKSENQTVVPAWIIAKRAEEAANMAACAEALGAWSADRRREQKMRAELRGRGPSSSLSGPLARVLANVQPV